MNRRKGNEESVLLEYSSLLHHYSRKSLNKYKL